MAQFVHLEWILIWILVFCWASEYSSLFSPSSLAIRSLFLRFPLTDSLLSAASCDLCSHCIAHAIPPRRLSSASYSPPFPLPCYLLQSTLCALHSSPPLYPLCCWLPTVLFIDLLPSSSYSSPSCFALHNSFYVFGQPSLPATNTLSSCSYAAAPTFHDYLAVLQLKIMFSM